MRVIATNELIGFRAKATNYLVPKLEGEQQVWITRMIRHKRYLRAARRYADKQHDVQIQDA
jgi:hypothetical protein